MVTKTTEKKAPKTTTKTGETTKPTAKPVAAATKTATAKNANSPKTLAKKPASKPAHSNVQPKVKSYDRYAVLSFGTSQQLVCPGDLITVDLLGSEPGSNIELKDVLMIKDGDKVTIGKPHISGASVQASVMETVKGEKHMVFHKRRRKHSRKLTGHRQHYTLLKINEIRGGV